MPLAHARCRFFDNVLVVEIPQKKEREVMDVEQFTKFHEQTEVTLSLSAAELLSLICTINIAISTGEDSGVLQSDAREGLQELCKKLRGLVSAEYVEILPKDVF